MDKQEILENIEKFDLTDEQLQEIDSIISGENHDFLEKAIALKLSRKTRLKDLFRLY